MLAVGMRVGKVVTARQGKDIKSEHGSSTEKHIIANRLVLRIVQYYPFLQACEDLYWLGITPGLPLMVSTGGFTGLPLKPFYLFTFRLHLVGNIGKTVTIKPDNA